MWELLLMLLMLLLLMVVVAAHLSLQAPLHLFSAVTKVSKSSPKTTGVLAAVDLLRKYLHTTQGTVITPGPTTTP